VTGTHSHRGAQALAVRGPWMCVITPLRSRAPSTSQATRHLQAHGCDSLLLSWEALTQALPKRQVLGCHQRHCAQEHPRSNRRQTLAGTLGVTGAITRVARTLNSLESPTPPRSEHPHSNRRLDACRHTGCDWRAHLRGCRATLNSLVGAALRGVPSQSQQALSLAGTLGGVTGDHSHRGGAHWGVRRRSSH
jgi:hypothetical protein